MELQDLLPTQPEFFVKKTGKTYTIRKVGVRDHAWMINKHGSQEKANAVFKEQNHLGIAQCVYHLLTQEQRADFLAKEIDTVTDDGEKLKIKMTGPEVLLDSLEDDELDAMVGALIKAMMNGSPIAEQAILKAAEEEKKRMEEGMSQPTGDKSSISSPQSTDTPSSSLEK